jgi:chaperonin GroEL (HSP60 family)
VTVIEFQGLKPVDIADGYELAYEKVADLLPGMVAASADDLRDVEKVEGYLKSSIMSKQVNYSDLIADLVAKACGELIFGWMMVEC